MMNSKGRTMKNLLGSLLLVPGLMITMQAAPLRQELVPADAKWLVHIDVDNFRSTRLGQILISQMVDKKLEQPLAEAKKNLNLDLDPKKIHSFTAFGTGYQKPPDANGILIIQTTLAVVDIAHDLLKRQTNLTQMTAGPLQKLQDEPFALFSLKNEVFFSPQSSGLLLVSKSRSQLEQALQVVQGKTGHMKTSGVFADFPAIGNSFFFLGVAEGFNTMNLGGDKEGGGIGTHLPPQAKILQTAQGGQLMMGERQKQVYISLALKAKNPEGAGQMQQVIQGMAALLALSQANNPNAFLPVIQVTTNHRMVNASVEYPVTNVLKMIGQKHPEIDINIHLESESKKQP